MPRMVALCVLAFFAFHAPPLAHSAPGPPAGKSPESHTVLPPSLSPPLSGAQLAKQAAAPAALPAVPASPLPVGEKAPPFTTALSPAPGASREGALATKPAGLLAELLQRDLATALGRLPGRVTVTPAPRRPAPPFTALPPDPKVAGARAATIAAKLAHAAPSTASPPGPKPAALETRGPAPATLAPEQAAKLARVPAEGARRPR